MSSPFRSRTSVVALGGVLTAVGLTLLYVAAIAPSGRMGLTAVAGLCPVAAVLLSQRRTGYLIWLATSVLALILVPEKGVALSYCTIFGLYPVLKSNFEGLKSPLLRWGAKLLYGALGVLLLQKVLVNLLMYQPPEWMEQQQILLYGLGLIVFVVYDIGLSRLIGMISVRLGQRRV